MSLVDSVGSGLFLAASAVFFTRFIGLSAPQVGFGLSVAAFAGMVVAPVWGFVVDRMGARRVLIVLSLWRAVGLAAYTVVGDFVGFIVVAFLLGLADRAVTPVTQSLVAEVTDDRVATMAVLRTVRNVGFTAGALLSGVTLTLDTRPAYQVLLLADAASFAAAAAIVARLPHRTRQNADGDSPVSPWLVFRDLPYMAVAAVNGVLALHMTLLAVAIPLWVVHHTKAPPALLAPLLAVNTVLAALLQLPVSRGATSVSGAIGCLRRAGGCLAASCVLLAVAARLPATAAIIVLVLAVAAHTFGELYQSAGGWELSFELAPSPSLGAYLSVFNSATTVQRVVGPMLVTGAVIAAGSPGWIALAILFATTAIGGGCALRWAATSRTGMVAGRFPEPDTATAGTAPLHSPGQK